MSGPDPTFDPTDLALLEGLYDTPATGPEPRRLPWTWAGLTCAEQAALARLIDTWVQAYNGVHAISPTELIPPCWRQHPALAIELAVQLWLWYFVHFDRKATPLQAGEYYLRHLPTFRGRIDRLLGISPGECRRGDHPVTWRRDTDTQLATYPSPNTRTERLPPEFLSPLLFGFPPRLDDLGTTPQNGNPPE